MPQELHQICNNENTNTLIVIHAGMLDPAWSKRKPTKQQCRTSIMQMEVQMQLYTTRCKIDHTQQVKEEAH